MNVSCKHTLIAENVQCKKSYIKLFIHLLIFSHQIYIAYLPSQTMCQILAIEH